MPKKAIVVVVKLVNSPAINCVLRLADGFFRRQRSFLLKDKQTLICLNYFWRNLSNMEENLNQISNTIATSDVANNYGLFLLAIPFIYVIICCIVSNSSEKKVYFYSYLDVFLSLLPAIALIGIYFYQPADPNKLLSEESKLGIIGVSTFISIVSACFFAWRANQGSFFTTLFMFIGKIMFFLVFWIIVAISILVTACAIAFANGMKREKYQKRSSLRKEKIKVGSAGAVGGGAALCGLMRWGCKYHDFSIPPKVTKQSEIVEVENDEEI